MLVTIAVGKDPLGANADDDNRNTGLRQDRQRSLQRRRAEESSDNLGTCGNGGFRRRDPSSSRTACVGFDDTYARAIYCGCGAGSHLFGKDRARPCQGDGETDRLRTCRCRLDRERQEEDGG